MNTFQKIFGVIAVLGILYVLFVVETTEDKYKIKVIYKNELKELAQEFTEQEIHDIRLKNNHSVLFTDGDYLFESAPNNLKVFKCDLAETEQISTGFGVGSKVTTICVILFLMLMICTPSNDEHDYFD